MEWIFSGIGTAIVVFVLGFIGRRKYQENIYKSKQVSGENSIQINSFVKADNDVIGRDMIINHTKDEFDIGRMANMSNSEIEEVIRKGNNATVRAWCRELILENKQE